MEFHFVNTKKRLNTGESKTNTQFCKDIIPLLQHFLCFKLSSALKRIHYHKDKRLNNRNLARTSNITCHYEKFSHLPIRKNFWNVKAGKSLRKIFQIIIEKENIKLSFFSANNCITESIRYPNEVIQKELLV